MKLEEVMLPIMLELGKGPRHESDLYQMFVTGEILGPSKFCQLLCRMADLGLVQVAIAEDARTDADPPPLPEKESEWQSDSSGIDFGTTYLYVRLP